MRPRRLKPSPDCSRTASRRSSGTIRRSLYFALILVFSSVSGHAGNDTVDRPQAGFVEVGDDFYRVTYTVPEYDGTRIYREITRGMQSEIRFTIRVYRRVRGLRRLFGDAVLAEYTVLQTARWNPFTRRYIVATGQEQRSFADADAFLDAFLGLSSFPFPSEPGMDPDSETTYFAVQAEIEPVRYVPALRLLWIFTPEGRERTGWYRIPVRTGEAERRDS